MPNPLRPAPLAAALAALFAAPALAAPDVVTDIPPVHSIVTRIMRGVAEPIEILPPGASPHSYSLRPSEARELSEADLVIWVGTGMTPWLADPIDALATGAKVLTLDAVPGLTLLPTRASGPFEPDMDEGEPLAAGESAGGRMDQHIWLDTSNAAVLANAIAAELETIDPANAATYRANAEAFDGEMTALGDEVAATLAPARGKPYIVFHDAYQYFEHRFDIPAAGSIALHDGEAPSAARVAEIRDRVTRDGVVCAFSEPQFPPRLLATITEGTQVRTGALDPEGVGMTPGEDLYPAMIRALATNLATCLR